MLEPLKIIMLEYCLLLTMMQVDYFKLDGKSEV